MMTELLAHGNDRVVRAMSGALRNLAIDARNRDLLGEALCFSQQDNKICTMCCINGVPERFTVSVFNRGLMF